MADDVRMKRLALQNALRAKLANIEDPFIREKHQVLSDFADENSNLSFEEAWLKIDEIEQRESEET